MLCDPLLCTGCGSCTASCPYGCIRMKEDAEGFLRPDVDEALCRHCGRCEESCPILVKPARSGDPLAVYAVKLIDTERCRVSTSGGAFFALASHVIEQGGFVYGCVLDEHLEAVHTEAATLEELTPMHGSKYVQSRAWEVYRLTEQRLKAGATVLFSGTACQIAGLYAFLGQPYDTLYTVEVLCKGVPSPGLFRMYLTWRSKRMGGPIRRFAFRTKDTTRWGISMSMRAETDDKTAYIPANADPYFNTFLKSYLHRPCCYTCIYKNGQCTADFLICDYWGIDVLFPAFYSTDGVSGLAVATEHGLAFWEEARRSTECIQTTVADIAWENGVFWRAPLWMPKRDRVYADGLYPEMFTKNHAFRPTPIDYVFAALPDKLKLAAKRIRRLQKRLTHASGH